MATAEEYINTMYDAKKNADLQGLKTAYEQNVNTLNETADKIPATYYEARREAAGNAAIQRKNINETFAANGLNTGAVGQANLALSNQHSTNLNKISKAQADAEAGIASQRAQIETAYQNAIQQSVADNDLGKAQALYDEFQEGRKLAQDEVDKLLQYGVMPPTELISASGYSADYVSKLYNAIMAASYSGGGSGGSRRGSGGGGSGGDGASAGTMSENAMWQAASKYTPSNAYYDALKNLSSGKAKDQAAYNNLPIQEQYLYDKNEALRRHYST